MQTSEYKRLVVDVDPGIDDAHAILLLLEAERLEMVKIEAIIVTKGNTTVESGCKNLLRLLEMKHRTDIPIYKGVQFALLSNEVAASTYFGNDGLVDFDYEDEPDLTIIKSKPAPLALIELVEQNPKEISLVCLAPLTNVALAATIGTEFFNNVKEVFIMGGNHTGHGNETECAEFNFYYDAEAAFMVLQKLTCPTKILTLETCMDAGLEKSWRFDVLVNNSKELNFLTEVEKKFFSLKYNEKWVMFDAFMVLAIVYPDTIVRQTEYHATIELQGRFTRGQMVLDHLKKRKPNIAIIEELNKNYLMQILLQFYQIE